MFIGIIQNHSSSSCFAINHDRKLFYWGRNETKQLGESPIAVLPTISLIDHKFKNIYSGSDFTFGTTMNHRVFGWGENCGGQLGLGHNNPISTPTELLPPSSQQTWNRLRCGYRHTFGWT